MTLKYKEKVQICRQFDIEQKKGEIVRALEDSKALVEQCNDLLKLRAFQTRVNKVATPRPTKKCDEKAKQYRRHKYLESRKDISSKSREKRQKIRQLVCATQPYC